MIKIIGAKGSIKNVDDFLMKISKFSKDNKIIVQVFNADVIYGKNHLISAFEHAKRAIDRKTNTTNSPEMEILLYASGERQLKLAIPKMGVKKGNANVALVFVKESEDRISDNLTKELISQLSLDQDDKVLEGDVNTLKKFGITENEMETVTKAKYGNLILEKVALVDIIK